MYNNSESIITKQFDAGINDILTSFLSFSEVEHNPTNGNDVLKFLFAGIMNTLFPMHIGEFILRDGNMPTYSIRYYNEMGIELYKEERIEDGDIKDHQFTFDNKGKFIILK